MTFHIPVGVSIAWIVIFVTADFNLLEAPLWENSVRSSEVTAEVDVTETYTSSQ